MTHSKSGKQRASSIQRERGGGRGWCQAPSRRGERGFKARVPPWPEQWLRVLVSHLGARSCAQAMSDRGTDTDRGQAARRRTRSGGGNETGRFLEKMLVGAFHEVSAAAVNQRSRRYPRGCQPHPGLAHTASPKGKGAPTSIGLLIHPGDKRTQLWHHLMTTEQRGSHAGPGPQRPNASPLHNFPA